jgi:peptidoglycan/LPS O-acetylase OafA/YrhL
MKVFEHKITRMELTALGLMFLFAALLVGCVVTASTLYYEGHYGQCAVVCIATGIMTSVLFSPLKGRKNNSQKPEK